MDAMEPVEEKSNKVIMVVDDEDDLRMALVDRLTHEGYTVIEAAHGSQGIDLARMEPHPDLILLDIMMPVMSGHQTWAYMKKDANLRDIPILIISAKLQANDVFWGEAMPSEDYITKPFEMDYLLQRIREKITEREALAAAPKKA